MRNEPPPALLRRTIAGCVPAEDERWVLADIDALYAERLSRRGRWRANA